MPVSVDLNDAPDILAINAASAALTLSDIPWEGPVGAVRVGRVNEEFVLNPTRAQINEGELDLVVAGTRDAVIMVEAAASEIPEMPPPRMAIKPSPARRRLATATRREIRGPSARRL